MGLGASAVIANRPESLLILANQGNIGSTEGGLPFLEEEDVVELVVELAERSPILSIRG